MRPGRKRQRLTVHLPRPAVQRIPEGVFRRGQGQGLLLLQGGLPGEGRRFRAALPQLAGEIGPLRLFQQSAGLRDASRPGIKRRQTQIDRRPGPSAGPPALKTRSVPALNFAGESPLSAGSATPRSLRSAPASPAPTGGYSALPASHRPFRDSLCGILPVKTRRGWFVRKKSRRPKAAG